MSGEKGCRWIERKPRELHDELSDSPTHASIIKKVSCGVFSRCLPPLLFLVCNGAN